MWRARRASHVAAGPAGMRRTRRPGPLHPHVSEQHLVAAVLGRGLGARLAALLGALGEDEPARPDALAPGAGEGLGALLVAREIGGGGGGGRAPAPGGGAAAARRPRGAPGRGWGGGGGRGGG